MFEGREISVKLSKEADYVYQELNRIVWEEKLKGIDSSFHQTMLRSEGKRFVKGKSFCRRSSSKKTNTFKIYS